jgi:hypothetical protein
MMEMTGATVIENDWAGDSVSHLSCGRFSAGPRCWNGGRKYEWGCLGGEISESETG